MNRRLVLSTISGTILGVFCIFGANWRYDNTLSTSYLFGFWFNRLVMGVMIGLLPPLEKPLHYIIRGAVVGLFVSFAFYSSTNFLDLTGFLVGAIYGVIIEAVAKK